MYECSSLSQIPKKEKEIGFTKIKFFLLLLTLTIRLKLETFSFFNFVRKQIEIKEQTGHQ